ncbi:MAG: hypothetical protein KGJ06_07930 [Pseudomonadota bacterium]|nr:hypothetical protein [Pseudomonadota bacterium]
MQKRCLFQLSVAVALIAGLLATPALADTSRADLSLGMKTLPLLANKITGETTLAILFDPANPDSKTEAEHISAILEEGFEAPGDVRLISQLVPVDRLDKLSGSKIAVLTGGLDAYYGVIGPAAAKDNVLTMSTDLGCVRAHQCVLGLVSRPHVEIYYSSGAADAAHIVFGPIFLRLVTPV